MRIGRMTLIFLACLVAVVCYGLAFAQGTGTGATPPPDAPIALPSGDAVIEETESARVNWTADYIEARGQAVPPADKTGTAQGKLLARRGAMLDLQRNMLEFIKGVKLDSQTTMNDFMIAHDEVKTEVQGTIKNVEIIKAEWDGEIYTLVGRIKLENMRKAVTVALPDAQPKTTAPKVPSGGYTGLLIDARDLPLIPAMTFRVLDESGREVYGLKFVDKERFLASGLCEYQTNIEYAKAQPRITANPIVVKAVKVVAPNNVDIVIPNSVASKIGGGSYDFRVPCRVIVVKR